MRGRNRGVGIADHELMIEVVAFLIEDTVSDRRALFSKDMEGTSMVVWSTSGSICLNETSSTL